MEIPSIALAVISAMAGPGASVWVARLTAGRSLEDLAKAVADLRDRVTVIEQTEPETVAKLRAELQALSTDIAALQRAFDERARADDSRRAEAGKAAREREKDMNQLVTDIRVAIAALNERLNERTSALSQRMEDRHGR